MGQTTPRNAAGMELWLAHLCVTDSVAGIQIIVSWTLHQSASYREKCTELHEMSFNKEFNWWGSWEPSAQQGNLSQ